MCSINTQGMQPDRVLRVPGKVGHDAHAAHGERESRAACGAWASAASARRRAAREVVTDRDKPELETHDMTQVLATLPERSAARCRSGSSASARRPSRTPKPRRSSRAPFRAKASAGPRRRRPGGQASFDLARCVPPAVPPCHLGRRRPGRLPQQVAPLVSPSMRGRGGRSAERLPRLPRLPWFRPARGC